MRSLNGAREDEELAKKIYLGHKGSGFFMERAGVLDEYLQFGIKREREVAWAKEEIERLLNEFERNGPNLDKTYSNLVAFIQAAGESTGVRTLLRFVRRNIPNLDTMTLVLIAEKTFNLMKDSKYSELLNQKDLLQEEFLLVEDILKYASTMEFCVAPEYYKVTIMKNTLSKEQVRERIKSDIRQLESYTFPWDNKGRFWKWLRSKISGARRT